MRANLGDFVQQQAEENFRHACEERRPGDDDGPGVLCFAGVPISELYAKCKTPAQPPRKVTTHG